ncbi:MAG: hypothetical protein OCC45_09175 [Desulfotalea sp.]
MINSNKTIRTIDIVCRISLAIIFVVAGFPKIIHPLVFATSIQAYGILPDLLILPAAIFLPWFEIFLAINLVLNKPFAIWGSIIILLIFIVILSYAIYLGLDIDCGCFGPEDPEAEAFSGLRTTLKRDLLFLLLAVIPLVIKRKFKPFTQESTCSLHH